MYSKEDMISIQRSQAAEGQEKNYWCHLCQKDLKIFSQVSRTTTDVFCNDCQAPCEEITNQSDHPQNFVVYEQPQQTQQQQQQQQQQQIQNIQNHHQDQFASSQNRISQDNSIASIRIIHGPINIRQQRFGIPSTRDTGIGREFDDMSSFFSNNIFSSLFNLQPRRNFLNFDQIIENFLRDDPNNYGAEPANTDKISSLKENIVQQESQEQCSVCQDNYQKDDVTTQLPCNHLFHKDCVCNWLQRHNSCPDCRKPI